MVKERNFKCPICTRQSYSLSGIAIHIAMKRDEAHAAWRDMNWLPVGYGTITDAIEIAPRIMEILSSKDK